MKSQKKDNQKIINIALIGKVNSGKSTLFNRLIEERKAMSFQKAGTTRDRNYGICHWQGEKFQIIDTGGLTQEKDNQEIDQKVKENIKTAIKEADIIFFVTETKNLGSLKRPGDIITDFERNISQMIKKSQKPTILILNKSDNLKKRKWAKNKKWLALGFGKPIPISSANGSGIGDLLDLTIEKTKDIKKKKIAKKGPDKSIKISIIGRPNVGKSTLFNAILGKKQVIVSSTPHTTRGPQDTFLFYKSKELDKKIPLTLIDTAGIRKKRKVKPGIEKIGVDRSFRAMKKSDVIIIVLTAQKPPSHQDKTLIRLALKTKKAMVIAINKCDLLSKKEYRLFTKSNLIYNKLPMAKFAPRVFISAKRKKGINILVKSIIQASKNQQKNISEKKLNIFLKELIKKKGFKKEVWERIDFLQTKTNPLEFSLICPKIIMKRRQVKKAHFNIIKKALREKWDFTGAPIFIKTKCP